MAQSIHDLAAGKQRLHQLLGSNIVCVIRSARSGIGLVGNMEITIFLDPQLFQLGKQCRQELPQEIGVLGAVGGHIPTEDAGLFAIHHGFDLGGGTGTPLGKQVRHLKIPDAVFFTQLHPVLQLFKAEGIAVTVFRHIHQLHGGAVGADGGIQGRGENGGQQHGDAGVGSGGDKALDQLPMALALHLHAEIIGNAVAVEPLGKPQVVLADDYFLHINNHLDLGGHAVIGTGEGDVNRIFARLQIFGHLHGKQEIRQAVGLGVVLLLFQRVQHIGEQSGLSGDIFAAVALNIHRHLGRNLAHPVAPDMPGKAGAQRQVQTHSPLDTGFHRVFRDHLKAHPLPSGSRQNRDLGEIPQLVG